jgi:hypothetical protein
VQVPKTPKRGAGLQRNQVPLWSEISCRLAPIYAQILKDCRIVATHQRHTPARVVIDPAHYDGPSTERVVAPPPKDHGAGSSAGGPSLDRFLCRLGGRRPMNAPRPKLDIDTTRERLMALGCIHAAEQLEQMLTEAGRQEIPAHTFLDLLLQVELSGREGRRVKTALKSSNLPIGQTIENFDFAFQPAIERSRIDTLATCAWVRNVYRFIPDRTVVRFGRVSPSL